MRTPYKLQLPEKKPNRKGPQMLYTKTKYRPEVKITDWDWYREKFPIDNAPYCPGSLNNMLSHHRHFGSSPDEKPMTTTYRLMTEQCALKEQVDKLYNNPNKYVTNFYSFSDTKQCHGEGARSVCPEMCSDDYETTMQKSYRLPRPLALERVSFPIVPVLQNRRMTTEPPPYISRCKFYDDDLKERIARVQRAKQFRAVSFDPALCTNTDGSLAPESR